MRASWKTTSTEISIEPFVSSASGINLWIVLLSNTIGKIAKTEFIKV